jgi:hypothetical protein
MTMGNADMVEPYYDCPSGIVTEAKYINGTTPCTPALKGEFCSTAIKTLIYYNLNP